MDVSLPELPFPLRTSGPDGHWSHEDGVLTGWAGARQDRFVPPTGDGVEPAADAPRLLGAPEGDFQLIARVTVGFNWAFDAGALYVHQQQLLQPNQRLNKKPLGRRQLGASQYKRHRLRRGHRTRMLV